MELIGAAGWVVDHRWAFLAGASAGFGVLLAAGVAVEQAFWPAGCRSCGTTHKPGWTSYCDECWERSGQ